MYKEAIAAYSVVIRLLPDFALGYHGRALAHFKEEQPEPALEDFNRAIELDPEFADAYKDRALLYRDAGDIQKAVADLENAVLSYDELRQSRKLEAARLLLEEVKAELTP